MASSRWTCTQSGSGRGTRDGGGAGNSAASSAASSSPSGNGQEKPAALALPHVVAHRAVGDAERLKYEIGRSHREIATLPPRLGGPRRGWKKASLQQVLQRSYSLSPG